MTLSWARTRNGSDEDALFEGELGEIDRVLRSGDQVDELAELGLERHLQTRAREV